MSRHYSLIRSKLLRSRTGNLPFPVSVPCQLWLQTTIMSFIICLCLRISFLSFSFSSSDKIRRIRSRISRANLPFTSSLFTFTPNIANPPSILQSPTSPPSVFLMRSLRLSGRVSLRPSGKGEHSGCL